VKLQESRKAEIAELAEAVVELNSAGGKPVDPAAILKAKGVGLHSEFYPEKFDALLAYRRGKFHVHLNLSRVGGDPASPRARFSLAHELGHFFIDEHRTALLAGGKAHPSSCGMFDGADSIEEQEADHFAASLLMPSSRFVPAAEGQGSPLNTILALHKCFDVSLTATALQYVQHVSDRAIVLRWNTDGSLAWTRPGRGYRAAGYRSTRFKFPGQLPPDSATGRVIEGSVNHDSGLLTMASVFINVAESGDRNSLVTEEAISLGDYGVLTIISDFAQNSALTPRAARRRARGG
jgi:hypothetical protein